MKTKKVKAVITVVSGLVIFLIVAVATVAMPVISKTLSRSESAAVTLLLITAALYALYLKVTWADQRKLTGTNVRVHYKSGEYHFVDAAGNFVQNGSTKGNVVFGDITNSITLDSFRDAESVARNLGIDIGS